MAIDLDVRSTHPGRPTDEDGALGRSVRFLQPLDVGQQFLFAGPPGKVPAQHLKRSQGRFAARPQGNQHARQNRRRGLQLDPLALVAQEMPAAEDVFIKTKEDLNRPAILKDQGDHVRLHVHQIRRDHERLGLLRSPVAGMHPLDMRLALQFDHANRSR